ncbi:hypothetical protein ABI214_00345 [Prescottella soli]|uniref:Uncharacterized protein n=1 Tax=Prescottella soli TaxID=1543852 RepID=A0ABW9G1Y2_9NOCA
MAAATNAGRRRGVAKLLRWLSSFPGDTWQDRWLASGAEDRPGTGWIELPKRWLSGHGEAASYDSTDLPSGLLMLIGADVIRRMDAYAAAVAVALAGPDPWQGFVGYVEAVCAMQAADRGFADVLTMTFPTAKRLEARRAEAYDGFLELIARAQASGHLRGVRRVQTFRASSVLRLCLAAGMGWATREIGIAAGVGVAAAAAWCVPAGIGGLTLVALVVGGFVGVVVGSVSVVGGALAVRSAQVWPPRSARCWRHRFATCSAAAVFLLVAVVFVWSVLASTTPGQVLSSVGGWFLGISAVWSAVTYMCTMFLAPAAESAALR